MPNPNILPIPAEFPYVLGLSKFEQDGQELRRIAFQCGQIALARLYIYEDLMKYHPHACLTCREAIEALEGDDPGREFLVETVTKLRAMGYTKEQILEAMEDNNASQI